MGEDECLKSLTGVGEGGGEIASLHAAFTLQSNMLFGILCHLILFPVCAHLGSGLAPLPALRLEGSGMAD